MRLWLLTLLVAIQAIAGGEVLDYLDVDGQHYESVKWGPVNQGKVVIFHSRGVAYIPLDKLPSEYQARFGYKPEAATPQAPASPATPADPQKVLESMRSKRSEAAAPAQNTGEWATYNRERANKVLLDGKLVEKSKLKELTGFLVRESAQITTDERTVRGAVLELARRREDAGRATSAMDLRPSLWKGTGEQVLLVNYDAGAIIGAMLRVYVVDDGAVDGRAVYRVGTEPSFEQWQALSRR